MRAENIRKQNALLNEREMKQGRIILDSKPRIASLGLTLRCNLNCIMCFTQKMDKKDMDDEVFDNIVQLFPYLEEVRWNDAGEFFASRKCEKLLETINRVKIPKSYVSTNFKAAGAYMEHLLGGGFTHLSVSIDAATADTYHRIRRGGNFQELSANLERFHDLKVQRNLQYPLLTLVFVAMKNNINELPQFVEMANRYGAVEIHVLKLLPNPAGIDKSEALSLGELRPYYQRAFDKSLQYGIRLSHIAYTDRELQVEGSPDRNSEAGVEPNDPAYRDRRPYFQFKGLPFCQSPWTEMLIDVDGKVRPCCYHPKVLGDLRTESVLDIWNNEKYQEFRSFIRDHDFRECFHCSWLHKVFHYQVPEWSPHHFSLNKRLQTLERGWDLQNDIVIRQNAFTDLKIELDPMAFRLNKEWDLGTVLPEPAELIEPGEVQVRDRELADKERDDWLHYRPDQDIQSSKRGLAGLFRLFKKAIVRVLHFHTGTHFLRQRETNLVLLDQIMKLNRGLDKTAEYLAFTKTFLDNQKNFNALLVQYINQFSDCFFDRTERQKNVNMEILHSFRQTNERIDHLERDNALLLELINRMGDNQEKLVRSSAPKAMKFEDFFLSADLKVENIPPSVKAGSSSRIEVNIHNTSLREWPVSGLSRIGLEYLWFTKKKIEVAFHGPARQWLVEPLASDETMSVVLDMVAPDQVGSYRLRISLVTGDERSFSDSGSGFCDYFLEVTGD